MRSTTDPATLVAGQYHVEVYTSIRTGELILITCGCDIGRSHRYSDWVETQTITAKTIRQLREADAA